jgi:hypothetical protein
MNIEQLEPGKHYDFQIKSWETPDGDVVPGETRRRVFLGRIEIDGIPFLEVERVTKKGKNS